MRVVLAPDCFGGTLSAPEACAALAAGWRSVRPNDELLSLPMSDGGPGFLDCLPGTRVAVLVEDPLGRPVLAPFLLHGTTAYVESAGAAGLHLLDPSERDPGHTSTFGVGQLVSAAVEAGATRVVIGLGGTATNDGGAGFLAALGLTPRARGGLALAGVTQLGGSISAVSLAAGSLAAVSLVAATDVDSPLLGPHGASVVFGPQKGASPAQVSALEAAMTRWADLLEGHLGVAVRGRDGAGAAGGLGFALFALGAARVAGVDVVAEAMGLAAAVERADLVLTGEGRLDASSLRGKVVAGVARIAAAEGVPVVAVAGEVLAGRRELGAAGLAAGWSLVEELGRERALGDAAGALAEMGSRLAREWGSR